MGYEFVWRVDDDAVPEPNVLETLCRYFTHDVGAIGGTIMNPPQPLEYFNSTGLIENIDQEPNIQWGLIKEKKQVEHLYQSFLYRAGVHDYNLGLSRVGFREETIFTYGLHQKGYKVQILEASDRAGGRIKTDKINGFLLDRGFQVFLTEYPEAKALLNYEKLALKKFLPGATVLYDEGKFEIADPFRRPSAFLSTLFAPVGTLKDKLNTFFLKKKLVQNTLPTIFEQSEIETVTKLKEYGFSAKMIERFYKPFFSGIFLENDLKTSSNMFDFVMKMFNYKEQGYFVDLGSGAPFNASNTSRLEELGWTGICVDLTQNPDYRLRRCNFFATNALKLDYKNLFEKCDAPEVIDFLSLDIDEYSTELLKLMPFDKYKFKIIEF
jgi:hypothetical protein